MTPIIFKNVSVQKYLRWVDDIVKIAGNRWMSDAQNLEVGQKKEEAYPIPSSGLFWAEMMISVLLLEYTPYYKT